MKNLATGSDDEQNNADAASGSPYFNQESKMRQIIEDGLKKRLDSALNSLHNHAASERFEMIEMMQKTLMD